MKTIKNYNLYTLSLFKNGKIKAKQNFFVTNKEIRKSVNKVTKICRELKVILL